MGHRNVRRVKVFLIIAGILVAGYLVLSAVSSHVLKLNEVRSSATPDPVVSKSASEPPAITISVVEGPGYMVDGTRYDLASLRDVLLRNGQPVRSVAVRVLVAKGFAPTTALMAELRRLGISDLRLEKPDQPSPPMPPGQDR